MSIKSGILVMLQLSCMLILIATNKVFAYGLGLIFHMLGVLLGIWAILSIGIGNFHIQPEVKSDSLITRGPYKWIRNPMYSSVILFFIPIVFQYLNWLNVVVFIVLVLTLMLKILREEQFLKERFGANYEEYVRSSKRLVPFIF